LEYEELIKRVNAIQILVEAIADELIEKNIIEEINILKRLDSLDEKAEEVKSMLYFGPIGEA
jgi:tetrahydromethanopterin S-methyltransferase subunit G